ncbi:hypothetical protein BDF14DRAFT_1733525, partial [Spinellus fusiger]
SQIQELLDFYPPSYIFTIYLYKYINSIYYDVKANPTKHMYTFARLAQLCEENRNTSFNCFPLCKSFIVFHITIDTKILNHPILKNKSYVSERFDLWGHINLKSKVFKS